MLMQHIYTICLELMNFIFSGACKFQSSTQNARQALEGFYYSHRCIPGVFYYTLNSHLRFSFEWTWCDLLGRKMENARGARIKQMALQRLESHAPKPREQERGAAAACADRFCVSISGWLLSPGARGLNSLNTNSCAPAQSC